MRDYVVAMARYNRWQNVSILDAAEAIGPEARRQDRGAFFGSIEATLSHLLWADRLWLSRFADTAAPPGGITESAVPIADWRAFRAARAAQDRAILDWALTIPADWFEGELSWFSGAVQRQVTKPCRLLAMQLFNHQTHHRGQIHAMLTAAGARPDATDLPFMPAAYETP